MKSGRRFPRQFGKNIKRRIGNSFGPMTPNKDRFYQVQKTEKHQRRSPSNKLREDYKGIRESCILPQRTENRVYESAWSIQLGFHLWIFRGHWHFAKTYQLSHPFSQVHSALCLTWQWGLNAVDAVFIAGVVVFAGEIVVAALSCVVESALVLLDEDVAAVDFPLLTM